MEVYTGRGCWPGEGEGRIYWVEATTDWDRTPPPDRAAEILGLKEAVQQALADLERWMEAQITLGGRILLQHCREALQDTAFMQRVIRLINLQGLPAPVALVEAATAIAGVLERSEELQGRARALPQVARWLARRLVPLQIPAGAILAAQEFSILELLDRTQPALMVAGEPGVVGGAPLIWGLSTLAPSWQGRPVRMEQKRVIILSQEEAQRLPEEAIRSQSEAKGLRYEAERRAVLETARQMARDGLVRLTAGNVSCRIPGTDLFAITPSGMEYERLELADICILDLAGTQVEGDRRPSTEAALHRLAYQRRPDLGGVVHTHSLYATAVACTGQYLPVVSTELAGLVGGTIPCAPYAQSGSQAFAEAAVAGLGAEGVAVLCQNHGVVAAGSSLKEAYQVALGLEEAAMLYVIAKQVGEPLPLPPGEQRRIFRAMRSSYGQ